MNRAQSPRKNSGHEYALLELAERLEKHRDGRLAVHIHLSRLAPHNRRIQYIRLAFSTFDDSLAHQDGQTFLLRNNDIVFVGRTERAKQVEDAVIRLRYLFSEDALVQLSDESQDSGFCSWYVLDRDYPSFLDACRRIHQLSLTRLPQTLADGGPPRSPITPKSLTKLEELLAGTDLSNIIRNQPICALGEGMEANTLFHEIYVSIGDLEEILMPLVQLGANPWLFQYLTQILDKRMLAHLSREWSDERSFSINLNVSTILSPDFLRFDKQISTSARGRLVIEIQKLDIFADMGAFIFAREYARDRGYRLCLDGMTHLTLPFIDREKLGLDMVKLLWSPEFAGVESARQLDDLRACIAGVGPSRVILARCDSEAAIKAGRALGIGLFQGRYVNGLLQQQTRAARARA
ncbi:MAG TPA: hypothetical protein VKZ79_21635 [Alphaproteobacteria bacterium]|nr:hypothetical protein [Alphaproteobacteria bacterium]